MSYDSDYKNRSTAKKHFTKIYTSEELQEIKDLIQHYFQKTSPGVLPNTNEAYFSPLAGLINDKYFPETDFIKPQYLAGIYNNINPSKKKSIKR